MTPASNPFDQFLALYKDDPVRFVREVLGAEPDDWQCEVLKAIARGERRISVRSGHGVGKSTVVAWAILWFILTRFPAKVVVTAPTSKQLFDALFAEVLRWVKELPPALSSLLSTTQERIELAGAPAECFISARTARAEQPEALQGVHSENVMLVADEASGIPEPVFEAAAGSMSGHNAVTVLLGNPVRSSGLFFDTHHKLKDKWFTLKVSCVDSPRCSPDYLEDMKSRYGEDSNAYRVRVLGEFPRGDDDTVIPIDLVEAAVNRDVSGSPTAPITWGLDVARFGSDSSCLVKRQSNIVHSPQVWKNLDLMQLTGMVVSEYHSAPQDAKPVEILVDSIGLGAGVVDRLRELGLPARGINVSESPAMGTTYINLRAELWHKLRAWLEKRDCVLPKHERLTDELVTVRYGFRESDGKIKIESKDDMKRRGLKSPDCADALCLTFASDAGIALYGNGYAGGWNKPVRRRLALV